MFKIIMIIKGYILNNFTTHMTILQQMMGQKKKIKYIYYLFCQCGN
jgi:hypothetical protein